MTVADLAAYLAQTIDEKTRWKIFWEFLEEYRWEPQVTQTALLLDEPPSVRRWRSSDGLACDATRVTRDVDSLFLPHGVVLLPGR